MIKMCYHEIKEEDDGNFDVYMEHMYMCLANFMALGDIALYYAMLFELHKNMRDLLSIVMSTRLIMPSSQSVSRILMRSPLLICTLETARTM